MTEYQWYKQHGICVDCNQENALPGITYCRCCKARRIEYNRTEWEKHKDRLIPINREHKKSLYWQRKEAGLCTRCGKHPPETGKAKCTACLRKDAAVHMRTAHRNGVVSREQWAADKICFTCGKHPALPGKKLCQYCYSKTLATIANARKHIKSGWMFEDFKFGKYDKEDDNYACFE